MNSNQKGKRGEREARDVWREEGYTCRRTQQYCGNTGDASDITIEGVELHVEVKRCERGNPYEWLNQAITDSLKTDKWPVVQHKRNDHPTIFILPQSTFFRMLRGSDLVARPR
jgi:hypothetical protein